MSTDAAQWADPHLYSPTCSALCRELATPSTLGRDTPPPVRCGHCGAPPGIACTIPASPLRGRSRPLTCFGRFHPSRMVAAA
jgi:hypothetical protein